MDNLIMCFEAILFYQLLTTIIYVLSKKDHETLELHACGLWLLLVKFLKSLVKK